MGFWKDNESHNSFYRNVLAEVFEASLTIDRAVDLSGGCINNATALHTSGGDFFLKWNAHIPADMFEKEARGLSLLAGGGDISVPEVHGSGTCDGRHYLLMQLVSSERKADAYWSDFGRGLARMHKENTRHEHGLDHDNYIGRLYQENSTKHDWATFFIENRLEVQLRMALDNGEVDKQFAERYRAFYRRVPELLPEEPPSLLHGDLWGGNVITGSAGEACIIDPAVYFGNREIELSFTRMFGGFGSSFYDAYHEYWPLEPGFDQRVDIYNMYPSMVHVNLFGGSYLSGVQRVLSRYL